MEGLLFTPLRRIATPGGDVFHGMKRIDAGYAGFGEAYFSTIDQGHVKGWKRHNQMTLNFVVPCGRIQVSVLDDKTNTRRSFLMGPDSSETYGRLTIPPGLWVAFGGGASGLNLLLNLASLPHDPSEADNWPLDTFPWQWVEA